MLRPSRRVFALLIAVVIASGGWAVDAERASACSGRSVPPGDPSIVAVILGRVTGTEYTPRPEHDLNPPALVLHATVEVDRYLRGSGPSTIVIDDSVSAYGDPNDELYWLGPCGAFNDDPRGQYIVTAIPQDMTQFGMFTVYGLGDTPEAIQPGVDWAIKELQAAGVTPASAGHAVEGASTPWSTLGLGVLGVAIALGVSRAASGSRRAG